MPSSARPGFRFRGVPVLALRALSVPRVGVRVNGPLLVFGQTAMFYYLLHRLALEIPATYSGLRGIDNISTTNIVWALVCGDEIPQRVILALKLTLG